jgi:indolepyruvate ferredoxin oxidoreductase
MGAALGTPTTADPATARTAAPTAAGFSLDDRYRLRAGRIYLTGIQALVRMLLDRARLDRDGGRDTGMYVTGYEGSPLAGYDLEIVRRRALLTGLGIVHQPGLNEELAATALVGTQLAGQVATPTTDGVTGIWYGKAPGLDRASDAIRHANLIGTDPRGGVVALIGDDPSAKSSSFPCSSEAAIADLQLPTFYPADPHEVLVHGLHAVELSRASGLWAGMKIGTNVADAAGVAVLDPRWTPPDLTGLPPGLRAYAHVPHARLIGPDLAALERSQQDLRIPLAAEYMRRCGVNVISGADRGARIGIVAAGKTWLDLTQALTTLGLGAAELDRYGIRALKLGAIWPVEPTVVREFAAGLDEIVVVEDKRAFLETAIKDILYGTADAPRVHGKRDLDGRRLFAEHGELDPDAVATGLARRLRTREDIEPVQAWNERRRGERISLPLAARTPYFCSGCPHNSSTKIPEGSLAGGGIGCHAMVLMMPGKQVGTVTGLCQMGGEGAQWIGMAPFVETTHLLQNIGDGTFAHSGSLAVRAAVAAGVNITYKLLFNSAVAMTGGQDAVGGLTVERIAALLLVEGATQVVITTEQPRRVRRALRRLHGGRPPQVSVRHRDDLVAVQEELAAVPGVTVLVHDQECAAEKRRKRKRGTAPSPAERVLINERVCEGCGDCGEKSNCLSVQPVDTEFGRKTRIHQSSCNLDFSCLKGDCPSFMTVVPGTAGRPTPPPVDDDTVLPEPRLRFDGADFAMRITGVGGTGVVTIAQILATAAFLDGRDVRSLDQTGLAQKGGAVVSDIKFGSSTRALAAKLAAGECDLYLGCDPLVATDPVQLKATDPGRTVAIMSTAEVPTGRMVVDTTAAFPTGSAVREAMAGQAADARYVAADELAEALFGDEQYANILLVGAAFQAGALPLSVTSIERAIELNGVAVERNKQAFRQGRRAVLADTAAAGVTTAGGVPVPGRVDTAAVARIRELVRADGALGRIVDVRVPELVAYQDGRYAERYARFVEQVRHAEQERVPGSTALAAAVARQLYGLMAYKDEYEVARLILDPAVDADVRDRFGPGSRVHYRLHPPVLRALGMQRKISLGTWSRPGFRALYALRGLRGTRLDPFGRAEVRRVERELVDEYRSAVELAVRALTPQNLTEVVALAELPDGVRGYEDVKLGNVAAFRDALAAALDGLVAGGACVTSPR